MPLRTSWSSSIEVASFRVVRRSRRGELGSLIEPRRAHRSAGPRRRSSPGAARRIDEQHEALVGLRGPGADVAALAPVDDGQRRLQRDVGDPEQRQALEAAVGAHEAGHEVGGGLGQQLRGGADLRDAPAQLHDHDEVAHLDGLVDVVGDEQDGLGEVLLEAEQLVLEAVADDGVDRAERLVHEQDGRVGGEGPRHADALALAARELAGVAVAIARRVEPDERQELVGALPLPRRRPAQQAGHRGDVVGDRLVREEADLLDDVADAAPQLRDLAARRCRRRR